MRVTRTKPSFHCEVPCRWGALPRMPDGSLKSLATLTKGWLGRRRVWLCRIRAFEAKSREELEAKSREELEAMASELVEEKVAQVVEETLGDVRSQVDQGVSAEHQTFEIRAFPLELDLEPRVPCLEWSSLDLDADFMTPDLSEELGAGGRIELSDLDCDGGRTWAASGLGDRLSAQRVRRVRGADEYY
jgi:hypothetical protein